LYLILENRMFYIKNRGDKYMLIEEKQEICNKCKEPLKNIDYVYRRKAPKVKSYVCSNCGYSEIYFED